MDTFIGQQEETVRKGWGFSKYWVLQARFTMAHELRSQIACKRAAVASLKLRPFANALHKSSCYVSACFSCMLAIFAHEHGGGDTGRWIVTQATS